MQEERDPFFPLRQNRKTHRNDSISIDHGTSTLLFPPYSKGRIYKNIFILDLGLFLFMWGFLALANLQSSLNSEDGVGTSALATMYATSMVSSILFPELVIKSIGCKMTVALSLSSGVPYLVANYWSTWGALIPTSFLHGLGMGCSVTATVTYIHEMARRYGRFVGADTPEVIAATFFGMYALVVTSTEIWGSLVSYSVLKPGLAPNASDAKEGVCGVNFVNPVNGTDPGFEEPTHQQLNLLVSIFVGSGLLSVLTILIFLDPLGNDKDPQRSFQYVLRRLAAAGKQAFRLDQLFLMPISIYCGLEFAFYATEYTRAFVACSWGVYYVGYVTVCYGVCGTLMSVLVGPLVKMFSQTSVILLAAIINVVTLGVLFTWDPSLDAPALYFVLAGSQGVTDTIWWSQTIALHGLMFPKNREAAFSNFVFWSFFGNVIDFSYSYYLTVTVKIQILITLLIVAVVLYVVGQIKVKCTTRTDYTDIVDGD